MPSMAAFYVLVFFPDLDVFVLNYIVHSLDTVRTDPISTPLR